MLTVRLGSQWYAMYSSYRQALFGFQWNTWRLAEAAKISPGFNLKRLCCTKTLHTGVRRTLFSPHIPINDEHQAFAVWYSTMLSRKALSALCHSHLSRIQSALTLWWSKRQNMNISFKCIQYIFSALLFLDVHLLQTQVSCSEGPWDMSYNFEMCRRTRGWGGRGGAQCLKHGSIYS
jgi:hypothetical protein